MKCFVLTVLLLSYEVIITCGNQDLNDTFEFELNEHFEEMTFENIQSKLAKAGVQNDYIDKASQSDTEILDEAAIDDEVRKADERVTYAPWKVILLVAGAAVGLVLLVGALLLVLKNARRSKV